MSALPCSCGHAVWVHDRPDNPPACHHKGCACNGYDGIVHVLLPNMAYGCGGNILTKVGASTCGVDPGWPTVTCPDCRALGYDYLRAIQKWMQGHGEHPDDAVAAPAHHLVTVGEQMDLFGGAA